MFLVLKLATVKENDWIKNINEDITAIIWIYDMILLWYNCYTNLYLIMTLD